MTATTTGSPDVLHAADGRCRLGSRFIQLSSHAESTVQGCSRTNRCIHGTRGLVVGWNAGPSQGQVGKMTVLRRSAKSLKLRSETAAKAFALDETDID